MYWPHKESTLWLWLNPCQLLMGNVSGYPDTHLQTRSEKELFASGPLQELSGFPAVSATTAGKAPYLRISSSTPVRASLLNCCFLTPPGFFTVSLGVPSNRYMVRDGALPFPLLCTVPSPAIPLFPVFWVFCVFCHILLPASALI